MTDKNNDIFSRTVTINGETARIIDLFNRPHHVNLSIKLTHSAPESESKPEPKPFQPPPFVIGEDEQ